MVLRRSAAWQQICAPDSQSARAAVFIMSSLICPERYVAISLEAFRQVGLPPLPHSPHLASLVLAGCCMDCRPCSGRSCRPGADHCRGTFGGLPQSAGHLGPCRLPTQATAAGLFVGGGASGRVWRGAAQPHAHWRDPEGHDGCRFGHRGRALFSARRCGLQGRAPCWPGQFGAHEKPGRIHYHNAGCP